MHDRAVLDDSDLVETVRTVVRFVVERDRAYGQVRATATTAAALPTGFVTLMMTNIEASTGLLLRLGDRYGDLLTDVRAILRAEVSRAGGREIDARADEFFAVFERAADAVAAAVAVQRTVSQRRWPGGRALRVRIGIHSGRPTLTGVGYIGMAVHTAARVCAAARGGQIVISGETRAVIADSAPAGVRYQSLGRYRLAGLPDAEALYQVRADGLRVRFPRPRTRGRASEAPAG